jgi:hypothetical protein
MLANAIETPILACMWLCFLGEDLKSLYEKESQHMQAEEDPKSSELPFDAMPLPLMDQIVLPCDGLGFLDLAYLKC